jgi:hypothetical protein
MAETGTRDQEQEQRSFFQDLSRSIIFPVVGKGGYILAGGVLLTAVMLVFLYMSIGFAAIFGLILFLFYLIYMTGYLAGVLTASAGGDDEPPDWPDLGSFWDECLSPTLLILAAVLVSYLPAIIAAFAGASSLTQWLLGWLAVVYMPMAIMASLMHQSFGGLNPVLVVRSIAKSLPEYAFAMAVLMAIYMLGTWMVGLLAEGDSFLVLLAAGVVMLYMYIVEARVIGLVYRHCEDRLLWFGPPPRRPSQRRDPRIP